MLFRRLTALLVLAILLLAFGVSLLLEQTTFSTSTDDAGKRADRGDTPHGDTAAAITLYRPISYYTSGGGSFSGALAENTGAERALTALLARLGAQVNVRYVPLRRAFGRYASSTDACIVVPSKGDGERDIASEIYYRNPFWIYVLKSSGITSFQQLESYGMIDGADAITGRVLFPGLERTYAPNFQSLIAMLRSGRVQAIPLGELAILNEPDIDDDLMRLDENPYLYLDMRLRCKRSPRTQALIDEVNAVLATKP
ncbi:hypothetical protein [Kordiimonas sp.]|uniref:hypothetical protein n=1 Tax=Kordiimonas sp. TaxID=1970157 RepID=UPI003A8DCF4E